MKGPRHRHGHKPLNTNLCSPQESHHHLARGCGHRTNHWPSEYALHRLLANLILVGADALLRGSHPVAKPDDEHVDDKPLDERATDDSGKPESRRAPLHSQMRALQEEAHRRR
eukprot:4880910-Prymnesium_polylepis.1